MSDMAKVSAPDGLELVAAVPPVVEPVVELVGVEPLVKLPLAETGLLPGAVKTVPLTNEAAVAGVYAEQVALSAIGQVESWQMAWVAGAAVAGIATAGAHR